MPTIHPTAFVHGGAFVIGDVTLGARVSVWPTAVLRGDTAAIVIGEDSNVQDGTIVHVDHGVPCTIGARVGIGHRAIIHGATVEHDSLIGMGAILLNNVVVGTGSIVGAGAVCPEGMIVPPIRSSSACRAEWCERPPTPSENGSRKRCDRISRCRMRTGQGSSRAELLACQLSSSPF